MVRAWLGLAAAVTAACTEAPTSPTSPVGGAASGARSSASTTATTSNATTTAASATASTNPAGYSLRFHGNPTTEVDRVKVPIDPQVAADLGGDLTIEFWLKTEPGANPATSCQAGSDGWTYGNVILDRDVFGTGDYGEYGVSLSGGRIAFGVGRGGREQTICGLIDVADGRWHHVAMTRRFADGVMRIYVDGTESAQGVGPAGDISYRDGRPTGVSTDPFLVVGASKADEGTGSHGFSGVAGRAAPVVEHPLLDAVRSPAHAVHGRRRHGAALPLRRRAVGPVPVERRRHVGPRHARPVPSRRLGARPARSTRPTRRSCRRASAPGSSAPTASRSSPRPTRQRTEGAPREPAETPPPTPNIR